MKQHLKLRDWIDGNKIRWWSLTTSSAIHLFEKYLNKINWDCLYEDLNPKMIPLFQRKGYFINNNI